MFTAALFTIAKTWKQPKCLSTEEWKKKCVVAHKYNRFKIIKIMSFAATWMDLESIIICEVSQRKINII